jgi:hypothetical protein
LAWELRGERPYGRVSPCVVCISVPPDRLGEVRDGAEPPASLPDLPTTDVDPLVLRSRIRDSALAPYVVVVQLVGTAVLRLEHVVVSVDEVDVQVPVVAAAVLGADAVDLRLDGVDAPVDELLITVPQFESDVPALVEEPKCVEQLLA